VLLILAQLAAVDDENRNENIVKNINNNKKHDFDFWEKQIISSRTLHLARSVIKKELGEDGIPKGILSSATSVLPKEINDILTYFGSL
jgi:hypothetical protein